MRFEDVMAQSNVRALRMSTFVISFLLSPSFFVFEISEI